MAASLLELGTMQTTAAELREHILDVDSGLNRVGKAYLHHLTDWQEHTSITASLTRSLEASCVTEVLLYQEAHQGWRQRCTTRIAHTQQTLMDMLAVQKAWHNESIVPICA